MGLLDGLIGDVAGGVLGMVGANNQNAAQAALVQQQENFQETMSNSAYQRATADMEKAGINPMLAFSQGGASTPGGSMTQMTNTMAPLAASAKDIGDRLDTVQKQMDLVDAQTDKADADTDVSKEQANQVRQDAVNKSAQLPQIINQAAIAREQAKQEAIETNVQSAVANQRIRQAAANADISENNRDVLAAGKQARQTEAEVDLKNAKINSTLVPLDAALSRGGEILGGAASALGIKRMLTPRTTTTESINAGTGEIYNMQRRTNH